MFLQVAAVINHGSEGSGDPPAEPVGEVGRDAPLRTEVTSIRP
jgi:hypothetical protein